MKKIPMGRVHPEETFVDTTNLPGFDKVRFEGTLEYPIRRHVFYIFGAFCIMIGLLLIGRAGYLTLVKGSVHAVRAEGNHLRHSAIVPERGVIYDRNGTPLAFNVPGFQVLVVTNVMSKQALMGFMERLAPLLERDASELNELVLNHWQNEEIIVGFLREWETANIIITQFKDTGAIRVEPVPLRAYNNHPAFSHVLGYVSRVTKEDIENDALSLVWGEIGRSGIERTYDTVLRGTLGVKIVEADSKGVLLSEGIYQKEEPGRSLTISISGELQKKVYEAIERVVEERGFNGGSAALLDAKTGEVLSLVSYPGYDANIMSSGRPYDGVSRILTSDRHPLFFRAIAGLYPPASTIKPFLAVAALEENIIDSQTRIYTDGQLVFPNPFNPDNPSIFNDWKNHGTLAMRRALAVSSNVYFFTIGGGFGSQEGLGHERIKNYLQKFQIGSRTGIDIYGEQEGSMPDAEWKAKRYPEDPLWRIGDTYNMSIGQGGMSVTPLQMARAVLALSGDGLLLQPRLLRGESPAPPNMVSVSNESLAVAREGMREAVEDGTARGVSDISPSVAAKTGTAELGKTGRVHSWFIGFLPLEDPELVMVINLENGPARNLIGATAVAHDVLLWYTTAYPQGAIDMPSEYR